MTAVSSEYRHYSKLPSRQVSAIPQKQAKNSQPEKKIPTSKHSAIPFAYQKSLCTGKSVPVVNQKDTYSSRKSTERLTSEDDSVFDDTPRGIKYKTLDGKIIDIKLRNGSSNGKPGKHYQKGLSQSKSIPNMHEETIPENGLANSVSHHENLDSFENRLSKRALSKDLSQSRSSSINLLSPVRRTPISYDNFVSTEHSTTPKKEFSRFPSRTDEDFRTRLRRVLASPHHSTTTLHRSKSPGRPTSAFDDQLKDLISGNVESEQIRRQRRREARAKSEIGGVIHPEPHYQSSTHASDTHHQTSTRHGLRREQRANSELREVQTHRSAHETEIHQTESPSLPTPRQSSQLPTASSNKAVRKSIPRVLASRKERIARPKSVPEKLTSLADPVPPQQRGGIVPPNSSTRRTLFAKAKQISESPPKTIPKPKSRLSSNMDSIPTSRISDMAHFSSFPEHLKSQVELKDNPPLDESDSGVSTSISRPSPNLKLQARLKADGTITYHYKHIPKTTTTHDDEQTLAQHRPKSSNEPVILPRSRPTQAQPHRHPEEISSMMRQPIDIRSRTRQIARPTHSHIDQSRPESQYTGSRPQSQLSSLQVTLKREPQRGGSRLPSQRIPKPTALPTSRAAHVSKTQLPQRTQIPSQVASSKKVKGGKTLTNDEPKPPSVVETNARIIRWLYDAQTDIV